MARGMQRFESIGNLGKDPETRSFPNGGSVCNCTLASSEQWRDKEGNQQERTEWFNLVFHNKLGEIVAQYAKKGTSMWVAGKLRTRKYEKDGVTHYVTEIHCDEMLLLGDGRGSGGESSGSRSSAVSSSSGARGGNHGVTAGTSAERVAYVPPSDEDFEDYDAQF